MQLSLPSGEFLHVVGNWPLVHRYVTLLIPSRVWISFKWKISPFSLSIPEVRRRRPLVPSSCILGLQYVFTLSSIADIEFNAGQTWSSEDGLKYVYSRESNLFKHVWSQCSAQAQGRRPADSWGLLSHPHPTSTCFAHRIWCRFDPWHRQSNELL